MKVGLKRVGACWGRVIPMGYILVNHTATLHQTGRSKESLVLLDPDA